jgi:hypothetical protein
MSAGTGIWWRPNCTLSRPHELVDRLEAYAAEQGLVGDHWQRGVPPQALRIPADLRRANRLQEAESRDAVVVDTG